MTAVYIEIKLHFFIVSECVHSVQCTHTPVINKL